MEILQRTAPINRIGDAKKSSYELNDNLMRFYFTYVYRNQSALQMLGANAFYDQYIAPTITEFISHGIGFIAANGFSAKADGYTYYTAEDLYS